jgi:hypothetical protein
MNHVTVLAVRSMLLAVFAMAHAFIPFTREDASIVSFGVLAVALAVLFSVSSRVTPGPHTPFVVAMAVGSGAVGIVAIVGGVVFGPGLLPWTIVVFGVVTGAGELAAAVTTRRIPRSDHLVLGGASLMLALVSLVALDDATWLSGTMVAWAAIGAVLAGTASVQWKDQIRAASAKETMS